MRRWGWVGVVILVVLLAVAVGAGAYNAGFSEGLEEAERAGEVIRVVGRDHGFFPFGLLFFPLFFFGLFFLARAAFWGGRGRGPGDWGPGHMGRGPWSKAEMVEDWHRRLHEQGGDRPGSGGDPAKA